MATAAELGDGALRLRDMQGTCDLCGDQCHPSAEICTFTDCNRCDGGVFHQHCVEKFLKKYGFDSIRKTGFPCPIGRGKKTKFPEECKGMVGKSHPIIPKNEEKKKKALPPPMHEIMTRQPKGKDAAKAAGKQPVKPPAIPRKVAPPKPHLVAATVLRSGGPMARNAHPAAGNAWHTAGTNNAIREAGDPAPAAAAPSESDQPRSAHVPVGLVLEEALTKAQKKNLARRKKKAQGNAADAVSETGTAATDVSSLDDFAAFTEQHKDAVAGTSSAAHQLLNGTNFVTDIKRYQQLLGLYCDDSDEEEDDSDSGHESQLTELSGVVEPELSLTMSPASSARPSSSASVSSTAPVYPEPEPTLAPEPEHDQDAALRAALEQSAREYALQQELQRQREILAGYQNDTAQLPADVAAVVASEAHGFSFPNVPIVTSSAMPPLYFNIPLAKPIAVAHITPMAPKAQPPTLDYNGDDFGYRQPQALWPEQQGHAAPHITATTAAPATYGAGFNATPYAPMAGGVDVTGASGADDDDLGSLLALCGVAG